MRLRLLGGRGRKSLEDHAANRPSQSFTRTAKILDFMEIIRRKSKPTGTKNVGGGVRLVLADELQLVLSFPRDTFIGEHSPRSRF